MDGCENQTGVEEDVTLASSLRGRSVFVLLLFAVLRFALCACVHCFPASSAQHWRSVCVSPNAIVQEFIRTQYAAAKMRHPGEEGYIVRQEVFMLDISCPATS